MNSNRDSEDKYALCFSDILSLFRKAKKKILLWGFALGLVGVILASLKPVSYESEGTLRQKGNKVDSFGGNNLLAQFSGGVGFTGTGTDSEVFSVLKSRKLLKEVVEKLGLQANLTPVSSTEGPVHNLKYHWSRIKFPFKNTSALVPENLSDPLKISALHYTGEVPVTLILKLSDDGSFEVVDTRNPKVSIGNGRLGEPFIFRELFFIPDFADSDRPPKGQDFILRVEPLQDTIKRISNGLKVESSKEDQSLIKIGFEHRNRHLCCSLINAVMDEFQTYLKNRHREIALQQLDYLKNRRDYLTENLKALMDRHADYLANDLYGVGSIDTKKEMEFLLENQHEYKEKLLATDLEIKRLEMMTPGNVAYYDRYSHREGDPKVINKILDEIRDLKQRRDIFEIELQKKSLNRSDNLQHTFDEQLAELAGVQKYVVETRRIVEAYENGSLSDCHSPLIEDHRFLLKGWVERIERARLTDPSNLKKVEENFRFYLTNLERLFAVHEHVLQERLIHRQDPSGEYQGITLTGADELYLDYSKQMVQSESSIRQNLFFIRQLKDPDFEITSLSSGLQDPISCEMIRRSGDLVLMLRDSNNQSIREQERIKDELNLQRTFLAMHLEQMIQLMELNKDLLEEKIYSLQNVSLGLLHRQISLSEKNLREYIQSRLRNLKQERELLQGHLDGIHRDLASLPAKWVSEQLVEEQVESNKLIVQEIVKLVESKNISHNIEVIQSAPLDLAVSSSFPKSPPILLWGCIGFFLGGVIGSASIMGQVLRNGLPVSPDNLRSAGLRVSGRLPVPLFSGNGQLKEEALFTLRRLQILFDSVTENESETDPKVLLIIEGEGPDYAIVLAGLYRQSGLRVLSIDIDFKETDESEVPGLMQYLKGDLTSIPIVKDKIGDRIPSGGSGLFGVELISSSRFTKLLEQLKENYDRILLVSKTSPNTPDAEKFVRLFPCSAITLKNEKVDGLNEYLNVVEENKESKLTFIVAVDDEDRVERA